MNPSLRLISLLLMGALGCPGVLSAATRLGLHVTDVELACWKQRAGLVTPGSLTPSCGTDGTAPATGAAARYRVNGDVQTNSPGDWTRILNNANSGNFSSERYSGQTINSCADNSTPPPPRSWGERIRDAAFVYMMTGTLSYRTAVLNELLAQAATSGTDFTNTTRWCPSTVNDGSPFWDIAMWVVKLTFAYDYLKIGDDLFAQSLGANETTLDNWFLGYANFARSKTNAAVASRFPNHLSDDYTTMCCGWSSTGPLTTASNPILYFGSLPRYAFAEVFSNRTAGEVRAYGLIAVLLNNSGLIADAKRFTKAWLRFANYPNGTNFSLGLWNEGASTAVPHGYNASVVGGLISFADAIARTGDTELYTFSTTTGFGSFMPNGGPKSLEQGMLVHMQMAAHDLLFYATGLSANNGNSTYLIDPTDERSPSSSSVTDTWVVPANMYFRSTYVTSVYRREHSGMGPYPASPSTGGYGAWGGEYGVFPGVLFMWGQLEGVVDPYNLNGGGPATIPAAPMNLRIVSP